MTGPDFADANNAAIECAGGHAGSMDFAQGTIIGLRMWSLGFGANNSEVFLTGVAHPMFRWMSGVNRCRCAYSRFRTLPSGAFQIDVAEGRCLKPGCGCGFWAYHNGSIYPYGNVAGVISAWGKTTIGTKGFRSEYAKILALYVPDKFIWPKTSNKRLNWTYYAIPAVYALLMVMGIVTGSWFMIISNLSFFSLWLGSLVFVSRKRAESSQMFTQLTSETVAALKENYPDVKFYNDYNQMVRDFPPSYETDKVA